VTQRSLVAVVGVLLSIALGGCTSTGAKADPGAAQPSQAPTKKASPVPLGTTQKVLASNSFGPGSGDVPIEITVYGFRDHVAPAAAIRPKTPGTHWASADVRVCRTKPVIFGYPAWVLEDAAGRVAQTTRVLHPQFPQPAFPNSSTAAGCTRGWVTWVTPDVLQAATINFEQARELPGPWQLR
jgi:hypothetical protein